MTGASIQQDRFVHDRLPPPEQWPVILPVAGVPMTGPLNCVSFLLDRHAAGERTDRPAIHSAQGSWSYRELAARVARLARYLVEDFGVRPGNRVLIRGFNTPAVAAIWLATQKIGAVAVTTMPLLRVAELTAILDISQPCVALCEATLAGELDLAIEAAASAAQLITWTGDCGEPAGAADKPDSYPTAVTQAHDVSLIAFTSGTTGRPKATVHFHRDVLAICETMCRHIVAPSSSDVFIGTAPLAFTFGLGGLLVFPLYAGASSVLTLPGSRRHWQTRSGGTRFRSASPCRPSSSACCGWTMPPPCPACGWRYPPARPCRFPSARRGPRWQAAALPR